MSDRPEVMDEGYVRPRRVRKKKTRWEIFKEAYLPFVIVLLAVVLVVAMIVGIVKLIAGSKKPDVPTTEDTAPVTTDPHATPAQVQSALNQAEHLASWYDYDGAISLLNAVDTDDNRVAQAISDYSLARQTLLAWPDNTEVPMISFQPLVVDTSRAFDGDENSSYYNRVSVTAEEYRAILAQLYENNYVLVNLTDMASPSGTQMKENVIYLPEGKKPLVMSLVPAHYTALQAGDGYARRLALDNSGKVTSEYVDANGKVTGAYDFVTILEEFVAEHPDFSYRGSKAILALNGDAGPLGYKLDDPSEASELKNLAAALKDLGYQFASFTYDGLRYGDVDFADMKSDAELWNSTYSPILGSTQILIFAGGSSLEEFEGEKFDCLYSLGFRYFCGMDNNVTSWVKLEDTYLRIDRRTINGTRLTEDKDLLTDLFDARTVLDKGRP